MQALYQLILTLRIQVPKIEARFYAVMPRWIGYFTVTYFAGFLGLVRPQASAIATPV